MHTGNSKVAMLLKMGTGWYDRAGWQQTWDLLMLLTSAKKHMVGGHVKNTF